MPYLITLLLLLLHGLLHGSWLAQIVAPVIYETVQGNPELHATAADSILCQQHEQPQGIYLLANALATRFSEHDMAATLSAPEQLDCCRSTAHHVDEVTQT